MIPNDFISRQKYDDINPHETIPTLFGMQSILKTIYYN